MTENPIEFNSMKEYRLKKNGIGDFVYLIFPQFNNLKSFDYRRAEFYLHQTKFSLFFAQSIWKLIVTFEFVFLEAKKNFIRVDLFSRKISALINENRSNDSPWVNAESTFVSQQSNRQRDDQTRETVIRWETISSPNKIDRFRHFFTANKDFKNFLSNSSS